MNAIPCVYRISIKALIKDSGDKILLIKHHDHGWELPGGGLEHGEDVGTGLEREIKEELGFTAKNISQTPIAFWTIEGKVNVKWFAFLLYEIKISGDFQPSDEAEEIGYFTHKEASELNLHENTKPFFSAT